MRKVVISLLNYYKRVFSPILTQLFGHACRFSPTCGEYTIEAVRRKGILSGLYLGIKRIARCNPFSKPGYDPLVRKARPHRRPV